MQRTDIRELIAREMEGETRRGRGQRVVQPNWNGVTRNQRTYTRDQEEIGEPSIFDRVPKEKNSRRVICIASISIRLRRAGGLETALRALHQEKIGIVVLQETKLTGGIHMVFSSGYKV